MKTYLILLTAVWFFCAPSPPVFGKSTNGPQIASTIDFLDYVYYDMPAGKDYYPLEHWEKRIAEMAEGGIDKIYFRVNVCGMTLYPSEVCSRFGDDGGFHWENNESGNVARLIKTLDQYDPMAETIRLGKKYGMEVWAWESIWEDGNAWAFQKPDTDRPELLAKYGPYPMMDPFFRKDLSGYSMKNPKLLPSPEEVAAINRETRGKTISRIELVAGTPQLTEQKIDPDNLVILHSADNRHYTPYQGEFQLKQRKDGRNRNVLEISKLALTGPYVKLAHRKPLPESGKFGIDIRTTRNNSCRVFDDKNQLLKAVWGQVLGKNDYENTSLDFNSFWSFAWDHGNSQTGFVLGELEPELDAQRYFISLSEFAIPRVMEHKVARFQELTEYAFDGFMLNLRMHGHVEEPAEYGFNPELRTLYAQKHGGDIWSGVFNRNKLNELRSDAFDEFLRRCKAVTGGRPLYCSVVDNTPVNRDVIYNLAEYAKKIGLRWHYDRWFEQNSVDGIIMIGDYFPKQFKGKRSGERPVRIGVFREMAFADKKFNFAEDLRRLMADPDLDEIELYETLEMVPWHPERLKLIRQLKQEKK